MYDRNSSIKFKILDLHQSFCKTYRDEYQNFIPRVEGIIRNFGTVKFYVNTLDFDGWQWPMVWVVFCLELGIEISPQK